MVKKALKSNGKKRSQVSVRAAAARKGTQIQSHAPSLENGSLKRFPIVGIGASAGGLEAFTLFLKNLPVDTGMAFVLVQHLDPVHESALTQLLARTTLMPVTEVTQGTVVSPNHVYVIPRNTCMEIARGVLKLGPREKPRAPSGRLTSFLNRSHRINESGPLASSFRARLISRRSLPTRRH